MAPTARMTVELPDGRTATGTLDLPSGAYSSLGRITAGPMHVGVNPRYDEYALWFGKFTAPPAYTRVFSAPGEGLAPINGARVGGIPSDTIPWISHKDEVPITEVVDYWSRLIEARAPSSNRPLRWTFRHEGEDSDHTRWTAYWRDLRLAWEDFERRDLVELVNIHTLYPSRWSVTVTNWRRWMLPQAAHLDGWDCYPSREVYEPPGSLLGLPVAASREFGMPYCVPELGSPLRGGDTGALRAAWFTECLDYLAATGCRYVGFWCSKETLGGKIVDYRPHDTPTLAAWNAAFAKYRP
jgi:hypothetical protein